ncbi:vitamin K epoxide reductase family protein [Puia sp.]|jgi:uncharacterized membrane protein|uniref:vitamin K epoxide reductase family protein n=1 Tax=Puia sp. TaxID=2045100 RepID=UPI002F3FAC1A
MAQSFDTSLKNVAGHYARLLKVKITASSIKRSIEENPHFPSLLSLTETFSRYHINNKAFEIRAENLDRLEPPFIAYLKLPKVGKDFVLVTGISGSSVEYLYKDRKAHTISKDEFLQKYQNVVWIAEPDEQSGEKDFARKLGQEKAARNKRLVWTAGVVLLMLTAFVANLSGGNIFAFTSIAILKGIGTASAVLLIVYENNKENAFAKNICRAGRQMNCDAILNSKASKIGGISWSEVGLFYFASTSMLLLFPNIDLKEKIGWLAVLNACAVPYTIFSIYYQSVVAKQWCPLCLTVQSVLLGELIWSAFNFWAAPNPSFFPTAFAMPFAGIRLIYVLLLGIVILAWYGVKPLIKSANNANSFESAYKRLQYNPEIFKGLLQQQAAAPEGWQQLGINLGNPAAPNTILKVCNPYCGPCAKAHRHLEEMLKNSDEVRLKVIFTAPNDEQNRSTIVVKHLLQIASEGDPAKTQRSLDDWYLGENKDYEAFAGKYPLSQNKADVGSQLEAMSKWCEDAGITSTPTLFMNGFQLPEGYGGEELKNIFY